MTESVNLYVGMFARRRLDKVALVGSWTKTVHVGSLEA